MQSELLAQECAKFIKVVTCAFGQQFDFQFVKEMLTPASIDHPFIKCHISDAARTAPDTHRSAQGFDGEHRLQRSAACQGKRPITHVAGRPALRIIAIDRHFPFRTLMKPVLRQRFALQGCNPAVPDGAHAQTVPLGAQTKIRGVVVDIVLMFTISHRL